eukprot:gnl/MRDRNA2_/MRDRNA2_138966_c0_seq1.p1 gnl/MRDRNA2_/MRDRNA2_138966_c0~~gnl/MRDRNA2_/MRDRNA2_138966_c0_seq1.p1  ORF type:complete len:232 (+),score=36.85 gnl/MRDRNA2_/MRDRNA2_138966_c0_seq1:108-803(+)
MTSSLAVLCCISVLGFTVALRQKELRRPANVYPPVFANTPCGETPPSQGPSSLLQGQFRGKELDDVGPGVSASINETGLTFQEVNKTRYCHELHNMRLMDVPPAIPLNSTIHPHLDWENCLKLCHAEPACMQVVYDRPRETCYPFANFTLLEFQGDYDASSFSSARCGNSKVMDRILKELDEQAQAENKTDAEVVEVDAGGKVSASGQLNMVRGHHARNQLSQLRIRDRFL